MAKVAERSEAGGPGGPVGRVRIGSRLRSGEVGAREVRQVRIPRELFRGLCDRARRHAGDPRHRSHLLGHRSPLSRDPRIRRAGEVPLRPQPPHRAARDPRPMHGPAGRRTAASSARSCRSPGPSREGKPGSPDSSGRMQRRGSTHPSSLGTKPASMVKMNPIATWTDFDVAGYVADHDLPKHPLMSRGYLSIGCAPTTRPVAPGEDRRAGRFIWHGDHRMRPSRLSLGAHGRDGVPAPVSQDGRAEPDRALEARPQPARRR